MQAVRIACGVDYFTVRVGTRIVDKLWCIIARTVPSRQRQQTLPSAGGNAKRCGRNVLTGVGWRAAGPVALEVQANGRSMARAKHEGGG